MQCEIRRWAEFPARRTYQMPELTLPEAVGSTSTAKAAPESNGRPSATGVRQLLEFEKPLSKIEEQIHLLQAQQDAKGVDYSKELRQLRANYTSLLRKIYDNLSAWETVQVARHPQRPLSKDYVDMLCREFRELHGDRRFGNDPAIKCGLARLAGHRVMLIGHHKGKDTKEKVHCYFGLAHPEG